MQHRRTAAAATVGVALTVALLTAAPWSAGTGADEHDTTASVGDIGTPDSPTRSPLTEASTAADLADTPRDGTADPTVRPTPEATPTSQPTGSNAADHTTTEPLEVSLETSCRSPGEEQRVVVRATPGWQVTVNPRYHDGQMGNIHGGLALARRIGPDGQFDHTWAISTEAPLGEVEVLVGVQSTTQEGDPVTTSASFLLADAC